MDFENEKCPNCGCECCRDEVDIGVGVQYGPWGCPGCGWSAAPEYDRSRGPSRAEQADPRYMVDQWGGAVSRSVIRKKLEHFGLPGDLADEL